ncbi:MAG: acyl-CoA carboxylase epsilon subunit [Trebonia sp.]
MADDEPFLKIVKGDASAEEIAALVAALAAVAAARSGDGDGSERGPVPDNWNARARLMRSPVCPAADGWRRSALP